MDTSTLVFVAVLALTFLVLRWIITPIPQSVPEEFNIPDPAQNVASSSGADSATSSARSRRTPRRQVNDSMVEIVQAIGPQLTRSQIVYSLERTGNVEDTVNAYMETGSLPFPPGESVASHSVNAHENRSATASKQRGSLSLLERYDITPDVIAKADENGVLDLADDDANSLHNRKVQMILKARKRLEKTLTEPALQ